MKPYFKIRQYKDSKGYKQITLYYSHKSEQVFIDTGVKTKEQYWNGKSILSKCSDIGQDSDTLNTILRNCMQKVENIILQHKLKYGLEPTCDFLRIEYWKEGEKMERDQSVITSLDNYIKVKQKKIKNIKLYITIKKDLEHLYPDNKLYYRMVDKTFLKTILDYWLYDKKIQNSTVNKRLICLRAFLHDMYKDGINEFNHFRDFKSDVKDINSTVNNVILTKDEFNTYLNHQFKRKALSYVRDCYIISCVTGLRFSDTIRLSPDNFYKDEKGREWVISDIKKTEELQLRIPLSPIAKTILQKYGWQFRKISNQKANEYLEDGLKDCKINSEVKLYSKIGIEVKVKKVPKYEAVNFHSSRKYFITSCLSSGIPINYVVQWTGQSSITISKYIAKGENAAEVMLDTFK